MTKKTVNVSAIIPCYRCSNTIARAVESIDQQSLRPVDVILVDDCSGDGTLNVLLALQERYPQGWVKVIALKKNSGPGEARNAGWEISTQPYVAFLDADDSWHPQKIEVQYCWMMKHPNVDITGHRCVELSVEHKYPVFRIDFFRTHNITKRSLLLGNQLSTPSVMLKREIPHRFQKGKYYAEDYLLWLEIVCTGLSAQKIDLPLAYLYKAPYGEGGLSSQLLKMELGELDTYLRLWRSNKLTSVTYLLLCGWSLLRFLRRFLIVSLRS